MSEPTLTVSCQRGIWFAGFHLPGAYVRAEGQSEDEARVKALTLYKRIAASEAKETLPPPSSEKCLPAWALRIAEEQAEGTRVIHDIIDPNDEAEPSRGDGFIHAETLGGAR